ncbi:MAG: hypothetical protein Q9175_004715 [Cornicularia normoerica]
MGGKNARETGSGEGVDRPAKPDHVQPIKCNRNQSQVADQSSFPPSTVTNISHPPFHRDDHVHCRVISFVSSPPRRHHVGTVNPAFRACGWQCPQLSGANSDRIPPLDPLAATDKLIPPQRSTTSSSRDAASEAATSPFRLTVAGTAATAVAAGSMAWYYHLYGSTLYAMTPQEEGLHPTRYPWEHEKFTKTFDHQTLRRGFQVYREVCSSCHSLNRIPWRSLVGSSHTVDEMKAMAEENEYDTEPNDEGEIEKRSGKLSDYIPAPYKNDEAARAANNGALPPDLSLMVKARHGGCNYIFSLLTGYPEEPPPGATVAPGLNFNPYFPGTGIAMARVLYDGLVEYEDGTPATTSQMAKDVVEFLNWSAEPEMDKRKRMGVATIIITTALLALSIWVKRYKWTPVKTRKIAYNPPYQGNPRDRSSAGH